MTFDLVVAMLTGWMTIALFSVDIITSRRHPNWPNLPAYVRWGLRVTGASFMIRSVNLFSLAGKPQVPLGHANLEAVGTTFALTYLVTAVAAYFVLQIMPARVWERIEWLRGALRNNPEMAPVLLEPREITDVAHAAGLAAVGPKEPAAAVVREIERGRTRAAV